MARILAIDYGTKRTGLAVTDEMQIIASGLTTVETKELLVFLKDLTTPFWNTKYFNVLESGLILGNKKWEIGNAFSLSYSLAVSVLLAS